MREDRGRTFEDAVAPVLLRKLPKVSHNAIPVCLLERVTGGKCCYVSYKRLMFRFEVGSQGHAAASGNLVTSSLSLSGYLYALSGAVL
jgi:hypothetical protein